MVAVAVRIPLRKDNLTNASNMAFFLPPPFHSDGMMQKGSRRGGGRIRRGEGGLAMQMQVASGRELFGRKWYLRLAGVWPMTAFQAPACVGWDIWM